MTDPDRHLVDVKAMRCPVLGCDGKLYKVKPKRREVAQPMISAKELHAAVMGFGLPEERHCSPPEIKKLLVGKKITGVVLKHASVPERSIIEALKLEGGKVVHLGPSTKGATIYKVTDAR